MAILAVKIPFLTLDVVGVELTFDPTLCDGAIKEGPAHGPLGPWRPHHYPVISKLTELVTTIKI